MMMKTIFLISFLLLSSTVSSQTKEEKIKDIREKYRAINSDSSLQKIVLTNDQIIDLDSTEEVYDGGMEITGYRKDKSYYKIIESIGLSFGILTIEYYLWNNSLIFAFEKEERFYYIDSTAAFDYTRFNVVYEGRYYFDGGKLIEKIVKGEKHRDDSKKGEKLIESLNSTKVLLHCVF